MFSEQELTVEEEAEIAAVSEATMGQFNAGPAQTLFAQEQELLAQMTELAESSRALPDARMRKLIAWIKENMCPDLGNSNAKWNDLRVIIFTEWDDTKRYLHQQLSAAIAGSDRADERIAIFHGPTPPAERDEIKAAFNAPPSKHPVRILIATDAAREGLNLQAHCWNMFHFDVPWNPSRMEQRNGRIDRKLQPNPVVYCRYFFYTQRPEDKVLAALVRKTKTIREELGSLSQVIDSKLDLLMKYGIRRRDIDALTSEIESTDMDQESRAAVEEELEASRKRKTELLEQIENLSTILEDSQEAIAFSKDHFRSAISCALQILGAEPLKAWAERLKSGGMRFSSHGSTRRCRPDMGGNDGQLARRRANATRSSGNGDAHLRFAPLSSRTPESLQMRLSNSTWSSVSSNGSFPDSPRRVSFTTIFLVLVSRILPTQFLACYSLAGSRSTAPAPPVCTKS